MVVRKTKIKKEYVVFSTDVHTFRTTEEQIQAILDDSRSHEKLYKKLRTQAKETEPGTASPEALSASWEELYQAIKKEECPWEADGEQMKLADYMQEKIAERQEKAQAAKERSKPKGKAKKRKDPMMDKINGAVDPERAET